MFGPRDTFALEMTGTIIRRALLTTLALAAAVPAPATAQTLLARDAQIVGVTLNTDLRDYPYTQPGGAGQAQWRVVHRSGNCCENYVTTTPDGRIMDFGGSYVTMSADDGQTWSQVRPDVPRAPIANGEGAIVVAPNGDVLGVGWDPYSGDELLAFKYEAAAGKWRWNQMPLKTPFYDREWISVIPGPVRVGGRTVPYVAFVKGGYPSKEGYLYSTDGLDYNNLTSKYAGSQSTGPVLTEPAGQPQPYFDATQPNTGMGFTPLGVGRGLASPDSPMASSWTQLKILETGDFVWHRFAFPSGAPKGVFQIDSKGRLHNVIAGDGFFTYRLSADAGISFKELKVDLPEGHTIEEIDLRASSVLELGAVAIHAHDNPGRADQDMLFKIDTATGAPVLMRTYDIGLGDLNGTSGVGQSIRFDFDTLALLPDGRAVISFYDSKTENRPALAVELSAPIGPRAPGAPIVPGSPPSGHGSPAGGGVGAGPGPATTQPGSRTDTAGPAGGRHKLRLKLRRRGRKVTFSGTLRPAHAGRVTIQRRKGRRWVTVGRARVSARGSFKLTKRMRVRRGQRFRALAGADPAGHRRGTSKPVRLRR